MTGKSFLGTDLPIVQAPMAGVQDHALPIAVSLAGGLGSLPCAMLSAEEMREQLSIVRSETDRPLNTNFFCHKPPEPSRVRELKWREELQPYFSEFGINVEDIPESAGRRAFSHEVADVLEEEAPGWQPHLDREPDRQRPFTAF